MDNLTHSLVGLFLARSGFRHVSPRATAIMIVAANAPDFDIVAWLGGSATFLRWHRHITHSFIAIPVMALLSVLIVRIVGRRQVRWIPSAAAAFVAVLSHILLDLTNVYGVRLMLPFSGAWTHWDTVPVIDASIWAILLLGVAAPFLARLVNSEIGVREKSTGAGWAVLSLLLLIGYDWARRELHDSAVEQLESRSYSGLKPRRIGAFPRANLLDWDGIAELSYGYVVVPVSIGRKLDPDAGVTFYKGERTPAVVAAMRTEPFEHLQEFVQWPLWISETLPDNPQATRVSLMDLRFGRPPHAGFTAVATVAGSGQIIDSEFSLGAVKPRL